MSEHERDELDRDETDRDETGVAMLLASLPSPGPMPSDVSARIAAALRAEQTRNADAEERDDPELADALGLASVQLLDDDVEDDDDEEDVVVPLRRREQRHPRWIYLGAAAASVLALVVAGAVIQDRREDARTSTVRSASAEPGATGGPSGQARVHVQMTSTDYTGPTLIEQAQDMLESPAPTIAANQAAQAGDIGTAAGMAECVGTLGVADAQQIVADIARYDGKPAVVIVLLRGQSREVYVVERRCGKGDPGIIAGPVKIT